MNIRVVQKIPFPFLLLGASMLVYGTTAPFLGFYWDDWQILFNQILVGSEGFWTYFSYDRPLSAWTYIVASNFLGASPLNWHLFTLVFRFLTALGFWWAFCGVWPEQRSLAGWGALVFMFYPVFRQQPMAAVYSQHWMCYSLYAFSLGSMVWALRRPDPDHWLHLLSRSLAALALFTTDYFAGLELFRVCVLFVLAPRDSTIWRRVQWTLWKWLPYLGLFTVFLVWRFFLAEFPDGRLPNQPHLILIFLKEPFQALVRLATFILQDLVYIFWTDWASWLPPETMKLDDRFNLFALIAAGMIGFLCAWYVSRGKSALLSPSGSTEPYRQAFLLGLSAILIGLLPTWLTNRQIIVGLYSDRFGMMILPGVALAVTGLVFWLIPRRSAQAVVLGMIIAASINFNYRNANDYRWIWIYQQRFYWQMAWRAPDLVPGTALVADGEVMSRSSTYNTSFALNLLYGRDVPRLDYQPEHWFFSLGRIFRDNMPLYLSGTSLSARIRNMRFSVPSANGIAIDYQPGVSNCLHILRPEDAGDETLPLYARQAAEIVDLSRILPEGQPPPHFKKIFGPEPDHTWCYLYQKGELARQLGDWDSVLALAEQAEAEGYSPLRSESSTAMEWRAFIEGYARTGRWERATLLTRQVLERQPEYLTMMCILWDTPAMQSIEGNELEQDIGCSKLD